MWVAYSDHHVLPLPEGHRFPAQKYAWLRETLLSRGVLRDTELHPSPLAPLADVLRVHDAGYVEAVVGGTLDPRIQRRIGLPWSSALVARSLASTGGTLAAAWRALETGFAANLAGGTHHAFRAAGAGFCVFNDLAVAARALLDAGEAERVLIADVDVHQGDGTAALFADDPRVFTLSLHGARNFPFQKQTSDLDVALPDGTEDHAYLEALREAFETALHRCRPDFVFVQGGVDVLAQDHLGRLALSHAGVRARDAYLLGEIHRRGLPAVLTLGGGYARPLEATVEAHVGTYEVARGIFG